MKYLGNQKITILFSLSLVRLTNKTQRIYTRKFLGKEKIMKENKRKEINMKKRRNSVYFEPHQALYCTL